MGSLTLILIVLCAVPARAFFGTELAPLLQLVAGQVQEIERLSETVGMARDQAKMLRDLNDGIERTVSQIQSIQSIIERAQGLDPNQMRSLSDLNDLLYRAKQTQAQVQELMQAKIFLADQAISQSALQGDTAYKMGQEMVAVGSQLSLESQRASPGRASQISAASGSAQMLAQGVQLQTMAQLVQLQALNLEFQKSQIVRELQSTQMRQSLYERELSTPSKNSPKRMSK